MSKVTDFDGSGTMILAPRELRKGMYVSYLDRPWRGSPFPFQGFCIESDEDLRKLREVCEYVFVDSSRGLGKNYEDYYASRTRASTEEPAIPEVRKARPERQPTEEEFPVAKEVHQKLRQALILSYELARQGAEPDLGKLAQAASEVVKSVRRNPDALLYFVRTQTDGDYLYRHGVACAVMLCAFGDSMNMAAQSLRALTVGGALLDIGKTRVPRDLLNRPSALELSPSEVHQLKLHVERGAEILSQVTSEGSAVVTVIMTHHERYNGTGYPRQLSGEKIPRFGQMAGIVDMFDAMVSDRTYGRRATPYEAMHHIMSLRGDEFGDELVRNFRSAFGSYPTGTLVELSSGEVGFVIQQIPGSRLQPRVYLLRDARKRRINEFQVINLSERKEIYIEKSLRTGSYGIEY